MSVLSQKDASAVDQVEVRYTNYGWKEKDPKVRVYRDPTGLDEYLECTNPVCRRGRFPLGRMIREMVGARITESERESLCNSTEVSGRDCLYGFEVKVNIKYRDPQ